MFSQAKLLTGVYQNGRRHIHDPGVSTRTLRVRRMSGCHHVVTCMKGKCVLEGKLQ